MTRAYRKRLAGRATVAAAVKQRAAGSSVAQTEQDVVGIGFARGGVAGAAVQHRPGHAGTREATGTARPQPGRSVRRSCAFRDVRGYERDGTKPIIADNRPVTSSSGRSSSIPTAVMGDPELRRPASIAG